MGLLNLWFLDKKVSMNEAGGAHLTLIMIPTPVGTLVVLGLLRYMNTLLMRVVNVQSIFSIRIHYRCAMQVCMFCLSQKINSIDVG